MTTRRGGSCWRWGIFLHLVLVSACLGGCVATPDYSCKDPQQYSFCDQSLSIDARVQNLISLLTVDEKIDLLGNQASGVPRLGIVSYQWWNEALHGVAHSPGVSFDGPIYAATSFPQPILTAASFNVTLFNHISRVIATEARAFYNSAQSGLTFWTPNINVVRDPRWGRAQETPGEDPYLSGTYAEYFVRGLQEDVEYKGDASTPVADKLKVSACCKHYTAYDLDDWMGYDRFGFNSVVTQQDLDDTFNPSFEFCITRGGASCLMCSYNAVNGIPTCADKDLLTSLARDTWEFNGYITSDCDSVQTIIEDHKYADAPHAVADVLQAGMDLDCGTTVTDYANVSLAGGLLAESDINTALSHMFAVQIRLGLFDGNPADRQFGSLGPNDVCTREHQELALEAAVQGIVMLKNDQNTLPLSQSTIRSLAVIGPNANDTILTMLGNYAGTSCTYITPLEGLKKIVNDVKYEPGCSETLCNSTAGFASAIQVASEADATIMVVGLGQEQERESFDRTSLLLPGSQEDLISQAASSAKGPVVLVIMSGGPIDISFVKDDPKVAGIFWVGYPGQAGGEALAKIIFGERNPAGRLPMTWYPEDLTAWSMATMDMRPNSTSGYPGRTYRFYTGTPVFQFGYGLEYTNFSHTIQPSNPLLVAPNAGELLCGGDRPPKSCTPQQLQFCRSLRFTLNVTVTNNDSGHGGHVVMVFMSPPNAGNGGQPLRQLVAFQRVDVEANQVLTVPFLIDPCKQFSTIQNTGENTLNSGVYTLSINENEAEAQFQVK